MAEQQVFQEQVEATKRAYRQRYGKEPRWITAAPGRVNLIGEHTDYNDGFVFPLAIERYTVVAAGPEEGASRAYSLQMEAESPILLDGSSRPPEKVVWSSYVQGVVAQCLAAGLHPEIFSAVIHSHVPLGGGLSSSASLEVAMATLMEAMTGKRLDPVEKALLCQKAEHEYAKMPCGVMDQFIATFGKKDHAMLLDCRSRTPQHIPLADPSVAVLIANTNVKHELTGSEYPERRAQCEKAAHFLDAASLRDADMETLEASKNRMDPLQYRRARHVIGENARTLAMAEALVEGDWERCGNYMYASHDSLRDDYEVSCPELDLLVDLARELGSENGVIGSRMTGGGFGGCTVSLVRSDRAETIMSTFHQEYRAKTGIEPSLFLTRPAEGAQII
jgi:galactokinase